MSDALSPPAPPTPPSPGPPPPPAARPPQVGELTVGWRITLAVAWAAVFFAYAAVWKTSEELGLGTWWLGPRSSPQPIIARIIPFTVAVLFGVGSTYSMRRVPLLNLGGAILLIAIAVPDFWRATGIATIELGIGVAMLVIALASFGGRYRAPAASDR